MKKSIDEISVFLKKRLSKKRYTHSLNVADECVNLAECYGEDTQKAYFAGLLHDVCKEIPFPQQQKMVINSGFNPESTEITSKALWHAIAGAVFVRDELGVEDIDILNAIRFHTIAHSGMTRLEEIVYLADLISVDRDYKDLAKMRKLSYTNIDYAMLEALIFSIESTLKKGGSIPHYTIEAYNQYIYICGEKG